jgi:ribosomal-protein-alanine N-acetyltransferase
MKITTARLDLTRPVPADIDAIFKIIGDPEASRHNPSDRLTTRAEAEDLFTRWDQEWETRGIGYLVIRRHIEAETLGFCGAKTITFQGAEVLNLFYRLSPSAWGNGIATEAATAVVTWAKTQKPNHKIIARVRPENHASAKVATKAGLHRALTLDAECEDGPDQVYATNPARP